MPTPQYVTGAPRWIDLYTSDAERSRDFYTALFGWEAEDPAPEYGGYFNFRLAGSRIAGCMAAQPGIGDPDHWGVFLDSDDAARTVKTATANGGRTSVEPMAVDDLGTMAVVTDVGGATVGIWQPGTHPGCERIAEPGAPAWFELFTRDYDRTVAFYQDVFGWQTQVMSNTPDFRLTVLQPEGSDPAAGIMDATNLLEPDCAAHWTVYFNVADTDRTLATAVDLGGTVLREPEDTPFGRLAALADPTGSPLKIVA